MEHTGKWSPDLEKATKDDVFYTLTMFPYPSGSGLHIGHASVFTINDIIARYERHQGKEVLNPIGFDSFGLPTENYAIKVGKPAYQATQENTDNFLKQIESLDLSFDTERIFKTSDPSYYKWTQWIFAKLFEEGLAYRDELWVNWCPSCQTVLANDQVEEGRCERCKEEVIQKKMPQWFIKITDYADRLLEDLELIDWPEETKIAQRNWIGKSTGASIDFVVEDDETSETISVFTTRPDTIYGVTALVLAPENTILDGLLDEKKQEVEEYRQKTLKRTAVERQQHTKEKTGVFSGLYAKHPLTGEEIPVWYADYVLPDYATGSVMMVPAHDSRDNAFAEKFAIKIQPVIEGDIDDDAGVVLTGELVNSDKFDGMDNREAIPKIIAFLEEKGVGEKEVTYRLRDWSVSRQRYWGSPIPIYYDEDGEPQLIPEEELPVELPLDVENYKPKGKSPLAMHDEFPDYTAPDGKTYKRECDTLDTFMCSSFYFLRFVDPDNKEQLIDPNLAEKTLPVDFYTGGKEHTVGHLLYSRFIHKFLYDQGYVKSPEPFQKLVHQGMVLGPDGRKMSKRLGNTIDPLDVVEEYGADAVKTYLMFMGPLDQDKEWNDNALNGVKKFLDKIERIVATDASKGADVTIVANNDDLGETGKQVLSLYHETLGDFTDDIENYKFNTAVSKMMILVNEIYDQGVVPEEVLHGMAIMLSLFAPQVAEKVWKRLGNKEELAFVDWPRPDESKILVSKIEFPIQVNGKMRGSVELMPGVSEDEAVTAARQIENVAKYLEEGEIKKIIFVPDKIINFIVG